MKRRTLSAAMFTTGLFIMAASVASAQQLPGPATTTNRGASLFNNASEGKLKVDNRILINLNGTPISVMDVVQKMDAILQREYPEYAESDRAKYEFYTASWRPVLRDMIDKELILFDAERMEMEISNGEVRRELNDMFGPNVMGTLEEYGMSFDEAWELVRTDMLVRRMMMIRVNMKAVTKLLPKDIRSAYNDYLQANPGGGRWVYRVATIRDPDQERGSQIAAALEGYLSDGLDLEEAAEALTAAGELSTESSIKVSDRFDQEESAVSPAYRDVIGDLAAGSHSAPVAQQSRATGRTVYRVFEVMDKTVIEPPSLKELEEVLKNQLIEAAVAKETENYLNKLHSDFMLQEHVLNELIPPSLHPFSIN